MPLRMDRITTTLLIALVALVGFSAVLIDRLWLTY